jgi:hypothetical protein
MANRIGNEHISGHEISGDDIQPIEYVGCFVDMKRFFSGIALRMDLNGQRKAFIVRGGTANDLVSLSPHPGDFLHLSINELRSTGDEFVTDVHKLIPTGTPSARQMAG